MKTAQTVNPGSVWVVYCTCPDEDCARELARIIVTARQAACVSLIPGLRSLYRWQGEMCEDQEVLLMIKTNAASFAALEQLILQHHPYQVPEVLAVAAEAGHPSYLQWVSAQCAPVGSEE